jgi:alpha-1,3-rhamnosyltransferase
MDDYISVLIPLYNHDKYIVECLTALENQTIKNFEVCIIDDGSTDNSAEILSEYMKKSSMEISLFKQENQGVCATLNKLVSISKGNYIAVCASDDFLTPNSLEIRLNAFKSGQIDAVIGDAYLVNDSGVVLSESSMEYLYAASKVNLDKNITLELICRWSVVGPTLMLKKNVYDDIGLYNENILVEDRDFFLRLLAAKKLVFINQHVANYRYHADNSIVTKKMSLAKDIAESNIKYHLYFSGISKFYLSTYKVDFYLLSIKNTNIIPFLKVWNKLRSIVFNLILNYKARLKE